MRAWRKKSEAERLNGRTPATAPLDSGETRAIMIGAVILAVFLYWIKLILLPFVFAGIIAYICTPLLDWAAARTRWPRALFAVGLFVVILAITLGFLAVAGQRLVAEAQNTAVDLQGMLENYARQAFGDRAINVFGTPMNAHQIVQSLLARIRDWLGQTNQIALAAGYGAGAVMGLFLTMVLLFYFLVSGRSLAQGLFWVVPPHRRPLVARIWMRLDPVLMRYFVGVLAVVAYASVAAYIGLGIILGIKHAVLLALLTGILETVPVISPTAAAIIAGLVSLTTANGIVNVFEYAIYATVLRLSIDQVVGPVVLGRAARVHPVLIIFCFLAGGIILGIAGVILAVPIALVIKSTLATLYAGEVKSGTVT